MKNKEDIYKITCIIFMVDQLIKLLIHRYMEIHQAITIIPHFFSLYYVQNTGAAFSILENNTTLIILFSVAFILAFDRYIKKEKNISKLSNISFGLLLGGVLGNLLDRIIHHAVTDFLSFQFGSYSFPVFNIADIAITTGVILLIIDMFLEKRRSKDEGTIDGDNPRSTTRKSKH